MKTNRNIHTSSCLHCNPCGSGCTIVDNRISFVFDSEKKHFSHLLFDPTPVACMGRCGRSCQAGFRLVQEAKYRTTSVEQLKTINMSITNIICNGEITLVHGVNGLFLCEESWVTQSRKSALPREALNKETIRIKKECIDIERPETDFPDLT